MGSPLITLTIESTSGSITDKFNPNQKIQAVKVSSMAKLHIDPSAAQNYRLSIKGQNEPLPEEKSLAELNIADGTTLVLSPIEAEVIKKHES